VDAFDSYGIWLPVIADDFQETVFTKREFILRDLISLGEVWIEIVFSGEA
jgi:hypothetical protein